MQDVVHIVHTKWLALHYEALQWSIMVETNFIELPCAIPRNTLLGFSLVLYSFNLLWVLVGTCFLKRIARFIQQ